MSRIVSSLIALGGAAALLSAAPAFAHAKLESSSPAANATLRTAPRTITLTFNERLVPRFSKVELTMPAHRMKVPVNVTVLRDGKRVVATPASALRRGDYRVVWTAASADGHKMSGTFNFKVA
ncbi:copper homeostasis periplasmic binding protein CopC [Sphingomonas sp. MM-1]|uniref:copper homeostasis periplasmic binding protein CopC n=1 Tax=Sphingomonas sp. MM-1 TaxID=745310 RepID=UPI0005A46B18|nr:copper homeostasis periplasmic binding protein CopC [Sphingomonas sp. MM-1]